MEFGQVFRKRVLGLSDVSSTRDAVDSSMIFKGTSPPARALSITILLLALRRARPLKFRPVRSIVPQNDGRIYAQGSPRGNLASEQRDKDQYCRRGRQGEWIVRRDAHQLRLQNSI